MEGLTTASQLSDWPFRQAGQMDTTEDNDRHITHLDKEKRVAFESKKKPLAKPLLSFLTCLSHFGCTEESNGCEMTR